MSEDCFIYFCLVMPDDLYMSKLAVACSLNFFDCDLLVNGVKIACILPSCVNENYPWNFEFSGEFAFTLPFRLVLLYYSRINFFYLHTKQFLLPCRGLCECERLRPLLSWDWRRPIVDLLCVTREFCYSE